MANTAKMTAGTPASAPTSLPPHPSCPIIHPPLHATQTLLPSLHSVSAVASVVHRGRDGHYDSWHSISCQVEVLSPGVFALKHLHQHDVELHPFQEHPGEGCQEEEMEQGRKDCTDDLERERERNDLRGITQGVELHKEIFKLVDACAN